jgi:hypothetical protein
MTTVAASVRTVIPSLGKDATEGPVRKLLSSLAFAKFFAKRLGRDGVVFKPATVASIATRSAASSAHAAEVSRTARQAIIFTPSC